MLEELRSFSVENGWGKGKEEGNLKSACAEFEAIFLAYMLKAGRGTTEEGGLLGNGHESHMVKSMFDENLAMGIARNGGMGLATILYEKLKEATPGSSPDKAADPVTLSLETASSGRGDM